VVNIADADYTAVDVDFTAVAQDGWDPADVLARGEAAIADLLDPANWGQPLTGDERKLEVQAYVRRGNVFRALYDVEGLHDVSALTIAGSTTADYLLPTTIAAPIGMPTPGTITGTVT
jgi:hypothetical protein